MVIVNFRTPVDYSPNGIMNFGDGAMVQEFSGLYYVDLVKTDFQKGKFTQILSLRRLINQMTEPQTTEFGTLEGSEQTRLLREQEDLFAQLEAEGSATQDPNDRNRPAVQGASVVVETKPLLDSAPPEQTFNSDYPFP
jgi:hypothetical protein